LSFYFSFLFHSWFDSGDLTVLIFNSLGLQSDRRSEPNTVHYVIVQCTLMCEWLFTCVNIFETDVLFSNSTDKLSVIECCVLVSRLFLWAFGKMHICGLCYG